MPLGAALYTLRITGNKRKTLYVSPQQKLTLTRESEKHIVTLSGESFLDLLETVALDILLLLRSG